MSQFAFVTSCVNSTAERINEMVDMCETLSDHQFIFHTAKDLGIDESILDMLGYTAWGNEINRSAHALFSKDYGISCHKSWYLGIPCYYVRHSAIEYVYIAKDNFQLLNKMVELESMRTNAFEELEERWDDLIENAKLLDVKLSLAAKRFGEGNRKQMLQYRIPFQSFAVVYDAPAIREIKKWDRQNLK